MRVPSLRLFVSQNLIHNCMDVASSSLDEDDGSVSSTVGVSSSGSHPHQQQKEILQSAWRRDEGRHVHFAESASNKCYDNHLICQEDVSELWYSPSDYKAFRAERHCATKQARNIQKEWGSNPQSYRNVVQRVFEECCNHANAEQHSNAEQTDASSSFLSGYAKRSFRSWMKQLANNHMEWWGLERSICPRLQRERNSQQWAMIVAVADIQEEYLCNTPEKALLIAQTCQKHSRSCRLFATHLAQEQAMAAAYDACS